MSKAFTKSIDNRRCNCNDSESCEAIFLKISQAENPESSEFSAKALNKRGFGHKCIQNYLNHLSILNLYPAGLFQQSVKTQDVINNSIDNVRHIDIIFSFLVITFSFCFICHSELVFVIPNPFRNPMERP